MQSISKGMKDSSCSGNDIHWNSRSIFLARSVFSQNQFTEIKSVRRFNHSFVLSNFTGIECSLSFSAFYHLIFFYSVKIYALFSIKQKRYNIHTRIFTYLISLSSFYHSSFIPISELKANRFLVSRV